MNQKIECFEHLHKYLCDNSSDKFSLALTYLSISCNLFAFVHNLKLMIILNCLLLTSISFIIGYLLILSWWANSIFLLNNTANIVGVCNVYGGPDWCWPMSSNSTINQRSFYYKYRYDPTAGSRLPRKLLLVQTQNGFLNLEIDVIIFLLMRKYSWSWEKIVTFMEQILSHIILSLSCLDLVQLVNSLIYDFIWAFVINDTNATMWTKIKMFFHQWETFSTGKIMSTISIFSRISTLSLWLIQ